MSAPTQEGRGTIPQWTPLAELKPAPWNPRTVKTTAFKSLCASLEADPDFLWRRPILATADGTVYAGNQRYRAAEVLGWSHAPAVVEDVPERLAKERALRDNNNAGEYQEDQLAELLYGLKQDGALLDGLAFDNSEVDRLLASVGVGGSDAAPEAEVDRAEELREKWQTAPGQLWVIGRHRLLCGDCRNPDDMRRLCVEKVQGVFTSPPYAEQRKEQYASVPVGEYVAWWDALQANVRDVLKPDGSFFINIKAHADAGERSLYVMDLVLTMHRRWDWRYVDELCWVKNGLPGVFHERLRNDFEPIYHFGVGGPLKFRVEHVLGAAVTQTFVWEGLPERQGTGSSTKRERTLEGTRPGNVLRYGVEQETLGHAAAFPVPLPAFFVQAYSDAGDIWLDPFVGSGTTMVAAHQHDRIAYGMELEPKYIAVTLERMSGMGLLPTLQL